MQAQNAKASGNAGLCREICLSIISDPQSPLATRTQCFQLLSTVVENFKTAHEYLQESLKTIDMIKLYHCKNTGDGEDDLLTCDLRAQTGDLLDALFEKAFEAAKEGRMAREPFADDKREVLPVEPGAAEGTAAAEMGSKDDGAQLQTPPATQK